MPDGNAASGVTGTSAFTILWRNKTALAFLLPVILAIIMGFPGVGVLAAFSIAVVLALLNIRKGSFRDLGFRRQKSWTGTLLLGLTLGAGIQLVSMILVDPLLEKVTGRAINLTDFDSMRGDFGRYLIWLAIGWIIGGFVEEFIFRGYVITRSRILFGEKAPGVFAMLFLSSVPFGISHLYQGPAGMLSTGIIACALGITFIKSEFNIWLPILVHGFSNTVGITMIYLDIDSYMKFLW